METTDDMQHVFDAIAQTTPGDVRLRSSVTEERSDGTTSRDPAWTRSASGTRLAELDDGWVYRDGMIGLDALQVVALEEGLITDERTYPQGQTFWDAVDALRDRGAHVPVYEAADDDDGSDQADRGATDAAASGDDPGDATAVDRALEVSLLRERVADREVRIEALEAELDEREARIAELEDRLASLTAERGDDPDEPDRESDANPRPGPWRRLQRWLGER